jgi:hypothetical protein
MMEIPIFQDDDEVCIFVQKHVRSELQELIFSFAANKKGINILDQRISELNKSIAALELRRAASLPAS